MSKILKLDLLIASKSQAKTNKEQENKQKCTLEALVISALFYYVSALSLCYSSFNLTHESSIPAGKKVFYVLARVVLDSRLL
jgi:hypothetical protein